MFKGEFISQIGEKNRVAIPKKIRDEMQGELILTRGFDECALLVDKQRWKSLLELINKQTILNSKSRDLKRYLIGGSTNIEPDKQGRFVIPEQIKKFANLESELVFVGIGDWVEIWNEEKWNSKVIDLKLNINKIAEQIAQNEY